MPPLPPVADRLALQVEDTRRCVFYEMLTGQRAFQGEDVSLTLASVMKSDVNVTVLPADLPETLRTVIRRCLQKDTKQRVADMQDVRLAMDGVFETTVAAPSDTTVGPQLHVWQRPTPLVLAGLVLIAVGGFAARTMMRPETQPGPELMRLAIVPIR